MLREHSLGCLTVAILATAGCVVQIAMFSKSLVERLFESNTQGKNRECNAQEATLNSKGQIF
jgi:hypothetical protein